MKSDGNKNLYKIRSKSLLKIFRIIATVFFVFLVILLADYVFFKNQKDKISIRNIKNAWKNGYDYQTVYDLSHQFLHIEPFNNTALIYNSYASFFLSQSQLENQKSQEYLDECITNLRIAIYNSKKSVQAQIYYMLGKAYFYKNSLSSHYYSDLAVKYLKLAKDNNYDADDIPEYLGLSYASLGMTLESISAFTEALLKRESDTLLLSIAEQYYKTKEFNVSKQYLYRVINNSKNDNIIIKAHNLMGTILLDEEKYDEALAEFNAVLEKTNNSADAHYGIGVIYEKQGNIVKARAEWRNALRLQSNHAGALQKMSEN